MSIRILSELQDKQVLSLKKYYLTFSLFLSVKLHFYDLLRSVFILSLKMSNISGKFVLKSVKRKRTERIIEIIFITPASTEHL